MEAMKINESVRQKLNTHQMLCRIHVVNIDFKTEYFTKQCSDVRVYGAWCYPHRSYCKLAVDVKELENQAIPCASTPIVMSYCLSKKL